MVMNFLKINFFIILILSFFLGCGKKDNEVSENKTSKDRPEESMIEAQNSGSDQGEAIVIQLPTMQCGTCKKNIEKAVKKLDGVNEVNVVVKDKIANIKYDKSKTNLNEIEGVIVMAGYQANDKPANKEAYDKLEDCCKVGGHDK